MSPTAEAADALRSYTVDSLLLRAQVYVHILKQLTDNKWPESFDRGCRLLEQMLRRSLPPSTSPFPRASHLLRPGHSEKPSHQRRCCTDPSA